MFTIEVKINGSLISHIYGRNIGDGPDGASQYAYEYYEPEIRKVVKGEVFHARGEGIRSLVQKILADVGEKKPKGK
jgi:hypothetical protein